MPWRSLLPYLIAPAVAAVFWAGRQAAYAGEWLLDKGAWIFRRRDDDTTRGDE